MVLNRRKEPEPRPSIALLLPALAPGQLVSFSKQQLIDYTAQNPFDRLPDGRPDTAKMTDFFHRAAHDVTVAGKAFAEAYYAAKVKHA